MPCEDCGVEHGSDEPHAEAERMFATCMQKCGTGIIEQMWDNPVWVPHFDNHLYPGGEMAMTKPERQGTEQQVIDRLMSFSGPAFSHLGYRESFSSALRLMDTPTFVLIRDPRDQAVSHVHHIKRWPEASLNFRYADGSRLLDRKDPLLWTIRALPVRIDAFLPWVNLSFVMKIRFEELLADPLRVAQAMIAWTGYKRQELGRLGMAEDWVARIDPGTSKTFRRGIAGAWKEEFKPHHLEEFEAVIGDRMKAMGYET